MIEFLVRSHQAVVQHCRALKATGDLSEKQEQRLDRLLREAEAELNRLMQWQTAA
jgi:hypothetical protein